MKAHLQQLKGIQIVLNKVFEMGTICQEKVYERGTFLVKNGILKDTGLHLGVEPPQIKICWEPPPHPRFQAWGLPFSLKMLYNLLYFLKWAPML